MRVLSRRSMLLTGVAVLIGSALIAPAEAAKPTDPCAVPQGRAVPAHCTSMVIHEHELPAGHPRERSGPAPLPPTARSQASAEVGVDSVVCDGDGVRGERVEVLYVREPQMPERYTQLLPLIRAWIANADDQYDDGAELDGYSRHVRWVTEPVGGSCRPVVRNVVVPTGSLAEFGGSTDALKNLGYDNLTDRKYVMLTEDNQICGVGSNWVDDRPGPENWNNSWSTYARVDAIPGCLGANAIAHELAHTLGAVQPSAPHGENWANSGLHCTEQNDMMCYGTSFGCPDWNSRRLPDCNHDDYFDPDPAIGSYLATHWNIANSDFLIKGNTPDGGDHPRVGSTYAITSASTGEALTVIGASTSETAQLSQQTRTDVPSQRWLVGYDTGLQLSNVNSQLCLDGEAAGTTPGSTPTQLACQGGLADGMRWAYLPHGDGTYGIINWKSGLALTLGGTYPTAVQQQTYTGAANQRWRFNQLTVAGPQHNAVYQLSSLGNRENAEAQGASTASGALITHNPPSSANSQHWRLLATGSYWRLQNVNSGHCLDMVSASTTAGVQLRQATCTTSASSQQWTPRPMADGTFILVNRYSNLVIAMTGGSGSILDQQTLNADNRWRTWTLRPE